MTRCTSVDINFAHAFSLQGVEGMIPAGTYRIDTEEEPIDGGSWRPSSVSQCTAPAPSSPSGRPEEPGGRRRAGSGGR